VLAAAGRRAGRPAHIALFGFPGYGHVAPTLAVTEELIARGHQVTCFVADRFADLVAGAGAEVITHRSVFPGQVQADTDPMVIAAEFIRESFAPLAGALARFGTSPPDVLAHDALTSDTARILSRKFGLPLVRLFPGLGGNEEVPLNGTQGRTAAMPTGPVHPALAALTAELSDSLAALDVAQYAADGLASGADADHNLVFIPRAFQPQAEMFGDQFTFAGPCLRARDLRAEWAPADPDVPVALVSLGTSAERSADFFRLCACAFDGAPWQVVMTLGREMDPASLGTLPGNVSCHRWLPHLAVLRHAEVFVCQAGMGSVMESLYQATPLIAIPVSPDSFAVAERISELGLGRMISPDELTQSALRVAVREVTADPGIRARVGAFSTAVRECGGAGLAADVLIAQARFSGVASTSR
jgi:MGT family glycosyltransferase